MHELILEAVRESKLMRFGYKGAVRTVEPHSYGRQANRSDALCAWQLSGGSGQEFRLFRTDEIEMLQLLDQNFDGPRPGYRRGDARFVVMHAEL
jgi:predicted DNA-binding transcriptional regulator YafY